MFRLMIAVVCIVGGTGMAQANPFTKYKGMTIKPVIKHTGAMDYSAPPASFVGQHFTNAKGCTYSRTQAPGYPVVWYLLRETGADGCPDTVPGN